jgi:hypothetical protein
MDQTKEHLDNLSEIRSLMERSSRFISLSGLSGVFAGTFALLGAMAAYLYLKKSYFSLEDPYISFNRTDIIVFLLADASIVLILALSCGLFFSMRQAKKKGQQIWDHTSKRLFINLAIPLAAGGFFCLSLLYYAPGLVASATLVFYGLALLNGSKFTHDDIRYLGIAEIILGLVATYYIGYGLLFWALGFGVLHIIYGIVMYRKYDQ